MQHFRWSWKKMPFFCISKRMGAFGDTSSQVAYFDPRNRTAWTHLSQIWRQHFKMLKIDRIGSHTLFFWRKLIRVLKKHVFCYHHVNFQYFCNFVCRFVFVRRFFRGIAHQNLMIFIFLLYKGGIWKSKIDHPFSWIVIHNLGTWKLNTVFSMGIQKIIHVPSV